MQWILLLIVLIVVFRYDQIRNLITGEKNKKPKIDKNEGDDEGDYTDYEEIK